MAEKIVEAFSCCRRNVKGVGEHVTERRSLGRAEDPICSARGSSECVPVRVHEAFFHGLNLLRQSGL